MQFKKQKKRIYCQNSKFNSLLAFLCGNYKRKQKQISYFNLTLKFNYKGHGTNKMDKIKENGYY